MKLSLAFLLLCTIFTTHQRPIHGAVVVMVQQHGASSSIKATTPLDVEMCNGDKIVHDELTALLADHGARLMLGPEEQEAVKATGRSLYDTDHRAKYYRNPFEKLCISTGYCNPFSYGYRRSLSTDPEEQVKQEATGRSLYGTDHRAKYYHNPFEKLCISTGYCNPFSYGYRRSLRGATTTTIDNNEDDKSSACDGSFQAIKEGLSRLASQTSDDTCKSALGDNFLFECA